MKNIYCASTNSLSLFQSPSQFVAQPGFKPRAFSLQSPNKPHAVRPPGIFLWSGGLEPSWCLWAKRRPHTPGGHIPGALPLQESEDAVKALAKEKDLLEREKWELRRQAKEATDHATALRSQLDLKDNRMKELEAELAMVRPRPTLPSPTPGSRWKGCAWRLWGKKKKKFV